ncbi:hypothetical protein F444_15870 [Phytophthora nicotianae P1976]|uniref:Uncharacterized protein n=1 Tax=Phytophthora nicotianae P1976 TaxID=1317066 RepID=A0A080ZKJ9_PHYNI|nr:hypothetical protein F444_15870 [Phytophthora nicotianae P1976]
MMVARVRQVLLGICESFASLRIRSTAVAVGNRSAT